MAQEPLMDFFEWIRTVEIIEDEYCLEYDDEGNAIASHPYQKTLPPNSVKIDEELALKIFEGKESLNSFKINTVTKEITKVNPHGNVRTVTKMDDVLHRIVDSKWSNITSPDVILSYNRNHKLLSFRLGPTVNPANWNGDTEMIFLVTEYNDPNVLKQMVSVRVGDITYSTKHIRGLELPEKFSVYTRRIFENYIIEEV